MNRFLLLTLLAIGCTPVAGAFQDNHSCKVDGWEIHMEANHPCTGFYEDTIQNGWSLLVTRGWVQDADKPKYQRLPIQVHDSPTFFCGAGDPGSGCYWAGDHIEVSKSMGAIAHEWLHHLDYLEHVQDLHHQGWWTRGALPVDTTLQTPDSTQASYGIQPYLSTSWYGATEHFDTVETGDYPYYP